MEHLAGAHFRSDPAMESLPVVHWHLVSVREQPEAGTAAAKQGSYSTKISMVVLAAEPCKPKELDVQRT
jgi:hypothetical protein